MKHEKKVDIRRYDDSEMVPDEHLNSSDGENGNIVLNNKYMNVINMERNFKNNFKHEDNSDNNNAQKAQGNIIKNNNKFNELDNINNNEFSPGNINNFIQNELSRFNSRSFSNADLDFFTTKKSEMLDLELDCTNRFLNMSQFDHNNLNSSNTNNNQLIFGNKTNNNNINYLLKKGSATENIYSPNSNNNLPRNNSKSIYGASGNTIKKLLSNNSNKYLNKVDESEVSNKRLKENIINFDKIQKFKILKEDFNQNVKNSNSSNNKNDKANLPLSSIEDYNLQHKSNYFDNMDTEIKNLNKNKKNNYNNLNSLEYDNLLARDKSQNKKNLNENADKNNKNGEKAMKRDESELKIIKPENVNLNINFNFTTETDVGDCEYDNNALFNKNAKKSKIFNFL